MYTTLYILLSTHNIYIHIIRGSVLRSLPPWVRGQPWKGMSRSRQPSAAAMSQWVPKAVATAKAKALRREFEDNQEHWRRRIAEKGPEDEMRAEIASRWQQWLIDHPCTQTANLTNLKADGSHKQRGNVWFNKGASATQATLSLHSHDADMNSMTGTLKTHPLAVGSDGYKNFLFLEGKVNSTNILCFLLFFVFQKSKHDCRAYIYI